MTKKEYKGGLDFRPDEAKLWVGPHDLYSLLERLDGRRVTITVEWEDQVKRLTKE